jgi:glycosyltransferase involved in cell wall biosynthesis
VVDGASTDGTLELVKKYESKLSKLITEKTKVFTMR